MKRSLTILTLGALGIVLAGCMDDTGGGSSNPSPAPAPAPMPSPVLDSRWLGTAPFCDADPSDCNNLGPGWSYLRTSVTGDGAPCTTGRKVMCVFRPLN